MAAAVAAAGERLTVDGRDVAAVEVARTGAARRRGLLGRDVIVGAMLITPCRAVHTIRMRVTIDVAHLTGDGRVLRTETMRPGRIGRPVLRARHVLEAAEGAFATWGLRVGSVVGWAPTVDAA